jgi:hypothetical protein
VLSNQRRIMLAVVGIALAGSGAFMAGRLAWGDRNASAVADVGREYTTGAPLPDGLTVRRSVGFDGQFFYRLALNPFTTKRAEFGLRLDQPSRRQQRILYPIVAWIVSGFGRARAVPWALIAINIFTFAAIGWLGASLARSAGRSELAGLFFVATPGILVALAFDTGEVVAVALALATLLSLRSGRFGWATALATLALFARETTLVIPIGLLIAIVWVRRRGGRYEIGGRAVPLAVAVGPIVLYVGWQALLWARWGRPAFTSTDGSDLGLPIAGIVKAVRIWSRRGQTVDNAFFLLAVALVIVLGLVSLRRSTAHPHEKAAFAVAVLLALLYQWTVMVHYVTYLRALSETYVLGVLMLLEDRRSPVLPLGIAWVEVWGYLAVRARLVG